MIAFPHIFERTAWWRKKKRSKTTRLVLQLVIINLQGALSGSEVAGYDMLDGTAGYLLEDLERKVDQDWVYG